MKLITLLLLFTIQATQAAFIPSPTQAKTVYGVPLLPKGSLMTSDGVNNGSSTVCGDDQILVWDALEASGTKCEAKPVASPLNIVYSNEIVNATVPKSTATYTTFANGSVTITTTGGPIRVGFTYAGDGGRFFLLGPSGNGSSEFYCNSVQVKRNGTVAIFENDQCTIFNSYSGGLTYQGWSPGDLTFIDRQPAGTYTYTLEVNTGATVFDGLVDGVVMYAQELK